MADRILILGGTTEAADLVRRIDARWGDTVEVVTSLAGRLTPTAALPGQVRVGGFGGVDPLVDILVGDRFTLVIDATHPFAETISQNAATACDRANVPRILLRRPPWRPEPGDTWHDVDDLPQAAALLAETARRVFLATGPGRIDAFSSLSHVWFLVRTFEAPARQLPLPRHEVLVARPPFDEAGERALLTRYAIDTLVTKQSGGPTGAKLAAARNLGIPVIMVRRPQPPAGEIVESVDEAVAWIARKVSVG